MRKPSPSCLLCKIGVCFLLLQDPSDFLEAVRLFTLPDSRPEFLLDCFVCRNRRSSTTRLQENVTFFSEVSAEQAERFDDVDVFAMYEILDRSLLKSLQADPILSKVPAIAAGRLAILEQDTAVAMLANPGPSRCSGGHRPVCYRSSPKLQPSADNHQNDHVGINRAERRLAAALGVRAELSSFSCSLVALIVLGGLSLVAGIADVSLDNLRTALSGQSKSVADATVEKRILRTLLGALVGAALALSGTAMQAVTSQSDC